MRAALADHRIQVDTTRLAIFAGSGLLWTLAAFVGDLGLTPGLVAFATAYVLSASLVLAVRTDRVLLQVAVPWASAVAWWCLLAAATGAGVVLSGYVGVLVGSALFWSWAATAFLVLHAVRGSTPE